MEQLKNVIREELNRNLNQIIIRKKKRCGKKGENPSCIN